MPPKPPPVDLARLSRIRALLIAATAGASSQVACNRTPDPPPVINRPMEHTINEPPTPTPPTPPTPQVQPVPAADVPGPTPNAPAIENPPSDLNEPIHPTPHTLNVPAPTPTLPPPTHRPPANG